MGTFHPIVTLYGADGSVISQDSITVILEDGGAQPTKQEGDPYRKFDEGFAHYDYSKLFYKEYETVVIYHNIETGESFEAMEIEEGWNLEVFIRRTFRTGSGVEEH